MKKEEKENIFFMLFKEFINAEHNFPWQESDFVLSLFLFFVIKN